MTACLGHAFFFAPIIVLPWYEDCSMLMLVAHIMTVEVTVRYPSMTMIVFVNEVGLEQEFRRPEDDIRRAISQQAVVLAQDHDPITDLIHHA